MKIMIIQKVKVINENYNDIQIKKGNDFFIEYKN